MRSASDSFCGATWRQLLVGVNLCHDIVERRAWLCQPGSPRSDTGARDRGSHHRKGTPDDRERGPGRSEGRSRSKDRLSQRTDRADTDTNGPMATEVASPPQSPFPPRSPRRSREDEEALQVGRAVCPSPRPSPSNEGPRVILRCHSPTSPSGNDFRPIGREAVVQPERLEVQTPETDPFAHLPRTQSLIPEEVRLLRASFHNIHELNARTDYMRRRARSEGRSQSLTDPPAARSDVPDALRATIQA